MTKILLTRHGHVEGIKPARFRGRAELRADRAGPGRRPRRWQRASRAAWKPVVVYTSALQRCVVTGAMIAAAAASRPIRARRADGYRLRRLADAHPRRDQGRGARGLSAVADGAAAACAFPTANRCRTWWRARPTCCAWCWSAIPTDTVVMVGHDSVNRVDPDAAPRPAAVGLLAAGPGPLHPERGRRRGRRRAGAADQRHEPSGPSP